MGRAVAGNFSHQGRYIAAIGRRGLRCLRREALTAVNDGSPNLGLSASKYEFIIADIPIPSDI